MFSGLPSVESYASGKDVVNVKLPSVSALTSSEADDDMDRQVLENSEALQASSFSISQKQIPELVTLSLLPKSQWQSLINLDIIKVCIFFFFSTFY
jgi:U3 small nucleolar RNA-associated protein 21